jgi:hypothetical protein
MGKNTYENDMLDIASFAPRLEDRQRARRALEKYYGSGQIVTATPRTREQTFTRREWYERYRPDGSLAERGSSITTGRNYETF